jgi:hypothetical protein
MLGHDGQTQHVTVTQQRPTFTPVRKNDPLFDARSRTLHYSVDINPTRQDMDPANSEVVFQDTVSYSQTHPTQVVNNVSMNAQRKLTLLYDSVKLYEAQYDANGDPVFDLSGRLLPGELVDPSKWVMDYVENDAPENPWNYGVENPATRTMMVTVPDNRAFVLVYDYAVSMNTHPKYNNVPLNIKNSVHALHYEQQKSSSQTRDEQQWSASSGTGIITNLKRIQFVKHDAANLSHVLEGVDFVLDRYQVADGVGSWQPHQMPNRTTGADGRIIFDPPTNKPNAEFVTNTLYRLTEVSTLPGYDVGTPAPTYYFY